MDPTDSADAQFHAMTALGKKALIVILLRDFFDLLMKSAGSAKSQASQSDQLDIDLKLDIRQYGADRYYFNPSTALVDVELVQTASASASLDDDAVDQALAESEAHVDEVLKLH